MNLIDDSEPVSDAELLIAGTNRLLAILAVSVAIAILCVSLA
jgi:hypothetical protein